MLDIQKWLSCSRIFITNMRVYIYSTPTFYSTPNNIKNFLLGMLLMLLLLLLALLLVLLAMGLALDLK